MWWELDGLDVLTPGSADTVIFPPIRPNLQNTKWLPQRKEIHICWFDPSQMNQKSTGAQKLELFEDIHKVDQNQVKQEPNQEPGSVLFL